MTEMSSQSPAVETDRSWVAHFHKLGNKWHVGPAEPKGALGKSPSCKGESTTRLDSFLHGATDAFASQ